MPRIHSSKLKRKLPETVTYTTTYVLTMIILYSTERLSDEAFPIIYQSNLDIGERSTTSLVPVAREINTTKRKTDRVAPALTSNEKVLELLNAQARENKKEDLKQQRQQRKDERD